MNDCAIDIKLTPYLSKMTTDGESINTKNKARLKTKKNIYGRFGYSHKKACCTVYYFERGYSKLLLYKFRDDIIYSI